MKKPLNTLWIVVCLFVIIVNSQAQSVPPHRTFEVCEVKKTELPMGEVSYYESIKNITIDLYPDKTIDRLISTRKVIAYSQQRDSLVSTTVRLDMEDDDAPTRSNIHPFIFSTHLAYAQHRPLVISPDMIWLMITQGFAKHINAHAEKFRHHFVEHDRTHNIAISGDHLNLSLYSPDWEKIFPVFSDSIKTYIGEELHQVLTADFSTTGASEKIAFEVTLMDAMSPFFTYSISISCGIPEITLEGTVEDWQQIVERAQALEKYELDWWINRLVPVLQQFVETAKGNIDTLFWKDIYMVESIGCGEPSVNGWVLNFFPYMSEQVQVENQKNQYLTLHPDSLFRIGIFNDEGEWMDLYFGNSKTMMESPLVQGQKIGNINYLGPALDYANFPSGLSKADFILDDNGTYEKMTLIAGFIGAYQNKLTKALCPEIGWAVIADGRLATATEIEALER